MDKKFAEIIAVNYCGISR